MALALGPTATPTDAGLLALIAYCLFDLLLISYSLLRIAGCLLPVSYCLLCIAVFAYCPSPKAYCSSSFANECVQCCSPTFLTPRS